MVWICTESISVPLLQDFRGVREGGSASGLKSPLLQANKLLWRSSLAFFHLLHAFQLLAFEMLTLAASILSLIAPLCWAVVRWSCTASRRSRTEGGVFHTSDLLRLLFTLCFRQRRQNIPLVFLVNQPPQSRGFIKTKILSRYPAVTELWRVSVG